MNRKINAICTNICGLTCLVFAIITANMDWVIAGAIFKVAANLMEAKDGK